MKKNIIWIISWIFINVFFSMIHQYILTLPKTSIEGLPKIFAPLLGWDTIKKKYVLFFTRITLVILIILLISFIQKKYF